MIRWLFVARLSSGAVRLACLSVALYVWGPAAAHGASPTSMAPEADDGGGTEPGYRIVSKYDTRRQAQSRISTLLGKGDAARVRERDRRVQLFNLRLGKYPTRPEALKAQKRLSDQHIDSQVLRGGMDGYDLSVGAFSERDNAAQLLRRLHGLGFDNGYIVPIHIVRKRYVVEKKLLPKAVSKPQGIDVSTVAEPLAIDIDGRSAGSVVLQTAAHTGRSPSPSARSKVHLSAGMDTLRVEGGWLTDPGQSAFGSHYLRASGHTEMKIGYRWEFRLAGRIDSYYQQGTPTVNQTQIDYAPSYIRYDGLKTRITVGAQRVIWGRMDAFPPNDRLSVQDISRFILYRMSWRRRSVPELRVERYFGSSFKADLLWQPWFRPAKLPSPNSIWYPVDRSRGRIISVRPNPVFSQLVKEGKFAQDNGGAGGVGMRFSGTAASIDYAFSVQRARRSLPYYKFDPVVRNALLSGATVASAVAVSNQTFTEVHPWSWYIGPDMAVDALSATWRLEAAYVSDIPVTTADFLYTKESGVDWGAEVEFYPGDANTRVNLQLSGTELFNPPPVLDRINIYSLSGMIDRPFLRSRWHARLRFLLGLDKRNIYLNPEIAYTGWEPYEIYLDAHFFSGDAITAGGYHQNHDLITLGWRARY